jgi:hypothetical protein
LFEVVPRVLRLGVRRGPGWPSSAAAQACVLQFSCAFGLVDHFPDALACEHFD